MTSVLNPIKNIRKAAHEAALNTYSAGKWITRGAYTLGSVASYAATSQKVAEVESLNCFPKMIAHIFCGGDLKTLYNLHEKAAEGVGAAAACLTTSITDHLIGKWVQGSTKRRAIESTASFTLASALNTAYTLQEKTVEAFTSNSGILENLKSTANTIYTTLTAQNPGSDGKYFLQGAVTGLVALSAWKLAEILVPYLAQKKDQYVAQKKVKEAKNNLEKKLE